MNIDFRYYISVFFRRFPIFFVVTLLFSAIAVSTAYLMPTVYEAQARLLVEAPQIPKELAASTVQANANEQLQIFEQRMMTRANLLEIAHKRGLFTGNTVTPDKIVESMRNNTTIYRSGGRAGQATLMSIAFRAEKAAITAQVVNDYVTILLRDSVQFRTGKAGDTLAFFEQEVERLEGELAEQSRRILEFKNANIDALPGELGFRLSRQNLLQERLTQLQRTKTLLTNQRTRLIEVFNATGRIGPAPEQQLSPAERQLATAERQLEEALTIYSPENPRIRVLEAQVKRLRAEVGGKPAEDGKPDTTLLDLQLAEIDTQLSFVNEEIASATAEMAQVQEAIDKTPANSIALEALQRDYENIQRQYNGAVERLAMAATGERIELLSKGQRVSIIEQATTPTEPIAPNRAQIAIGGVLGAIFAGIGAVVLLELLNRSVRRGVDLTNALGITPIGVIPYTRTTRQAALRRMIIASVTVMVAVGIPAALYYIHTAYLPLDLILSRVMGRLGV